VELEEEVVGVGGGDDSGVFAFTSPHCFAV